MDETIARNFQVVLTLTLDLEDQLRNLAKQEAESVFSDDKINTAAIAVNVLELALIEFKDSWYLLYVEDGDSPDLVPSTQETAALEFDFVIGIVISIRELVPELIGAETNLEFSDTLVRLADHVGAISDRLNVWHIDR